MDIIYYKISIILSILIIIVLIGALLKCIFKIAYYETTLELMGKDINEIKNIKFFEMFKD